MNRSINAVLLMLVTALVVGGAVYWLKPSTKVDVSVTIEEMRNIARLATTEWVISSFAEKDFYDKRLLIRKRIRSDYVMARCEGKVTGSVDMEKAQIDVEVTGERSQVSIHFPKNSLLVSDPEIDPTTLQTISARDKIQREWLVYGAATAAERDEVQNLAMSKIKENAIKRGIVEKTKESATRVLTQFVGSLGYEATVTFDDAAYDPHGAPVAGQ